MALIPRLISWLRSLAIWLLELRLLWVGVGVPVLAFWLASLWSSEKAIRICGLAIEALGTSLVVIEILQSRRTFGAPGAASWLKEWLKRIPRWGPITLEVHAADHLHLGGSAKAHAWHGAGDGSVEGRLSALEKNLVRVRDLAYKLEGEVERVEKALSGELKSQANRLRAMVEGLRTQMVTANTEGHMLSAIGIVWVLIGLIASTTSDLIVELLQ